MDHVTPPTEPPILGPNSPLFTTALWAYVSTLSCLPLTMTVQQWPPRAVTAEHPRYRCAVGQLFHHEPVMLKNASYKILLPAIPQSFS